MRQMPRRAYLFAYAAHGAIRQRRKYTNEPYIDHPVRVAGIVWEVSKDPAMISAALLHDVVEDTQLDLIDIRDHFGSDIAELVSDLTDVSVPADGNRARRKEIDLLHTAKASPRAQTIKLADLIDNTTSIVEHDPDFARVYLPEKLALLQVLRKGDPLLWDRAYEQVQRGLKEIG